MRVLKWLAILLPWLAALTLVGWLFVLHFPPSGVWEQSGRFDGSSPWFQPFLPGQRVTVAGVQQDGSIGQGIIDEPVYASIRLPGTYQAMTVELDLQTAKQPLLEIGLLRDPVTMAYEMKPLWSRALAEGWRPVKTVTRQGLVRAQAPDSALDTTDLNRLVVWHATATSLVLADVPLPQPKTYDVSLRGRHDFFIVPAGGVIDFDVRLQSVNRSSGGNVASFQLTKDGELLWTDSFGESGRFQARPDQPMDKRLRIEGLSPGVYRLSFLMDDDTFIRRIRTQARRWVVGPRLYLGDTVGYASTSSALTTAWTNSQHLVAETLHPEGRQEIRFGSATIRLTHTHQAYPLARRPEERARSVMLSAPQGDVRLVGDGYFAFDPDALFLPSPRRFTDMTDLDGEGIQAVLTPYQPPTRLASGPWRTRVTFMIPEIRSFAKLTLSAPNIAARGGTVGVRAFLLRFTRPALSLSEWWRVVKQELLTLWRTL